MSIVNFQEKRVELTRIGIEGGSKIRLKMRRVIELKHNRRLNLIVSKHNTFKTANRCSHAFYWKILKATI